MILTRDNYYSREADELFVSVSQFKSYMDCEARTFAQIRGEYVRPESQALIVGSYTHAAFDSVEEFEKFNEENAKVIYNSKGKKYAPFEQADKMIQTLRNDELAMFALTGDKEVIMTGELFGAKWKIRVDNINLEKGYFSDLKTTKSLYDRYWSEKYGNKYVSFAHNYGYIIQMAVYREIIRQNTGLILEPYIVAVTKEIVPDKAIIGFDNEALGLELEYVKKAMPSFIEAKEGRRKYKRCDKCEYCRSTKKLSSVLNINDILK